MKGIQGIGDSPRKTSESSREAADERRGPKGSGDRVGREEITKYVALLFAPHYLFSLSKSVDAFPTLSLSFQHLL